MLTPSSRRAILVLSMGIASMAFIPESKAARSDEVCHVCKDYCIHPGPEIDCYFQCGMLEFSATYCTTGGPICEEWQEDNVCENAES